MVETKIKLKDYVVIDIENPNVKANSICSIAFIQVKDGEVVLEKNLLINPEDSFDEINIRINKITPNQVKNAITFDKFWNNHKNIIENNIIIGHGIKYDLSVITKTLNKYNLSLPALNIICTQKLAKKYLNIKQYKLDQVCDYLNIKLENHHNSLSDAKACLEIFEFINSSYGIEESDIEKYHYMDNKSQGTERHIVYNDTTKGLQNLKEIIESIMEDGKIEQSEINKLNIWLDNNTQLIGNYPFDKIYSSVKKILEDGVITDDEYNFFRQIFDEFINPLETENDRKSITFENMVFCLTGNFNSGSKDSIEEKIVNRGGVCNKGVNSKTNYLIVGGAGSDAWKFGNYGGKVQKAMELKEKGKNIQILGEDEFLKKLSE